MKGPTRSRSWSRANGNRKYRRSWQRCPRRTGSCCGWSFWRSATKTRSAGGSGWTASICGCWCIARSPVSARNWRRTVPRRKLQLGVEMEHENLVRSQEGAIGIITLNRPERRNALSLSLMLDLIRCLDDFGSDSGIRAIILAAAGKVFSSGHDLSEMVGRTVNDYRRIFDVCSELMQKIQSIPQPVIAQVQGIATAAGCQLAATCDLAIASEEATFATPGVKIGLFCTTPMVALSRAVGRKRAMEMLLTGRMVDAHTAAEWGLINRAVPAG